METKAKLISDAKKELIKNGIAFECKNNDYHFIIESAIDFWPTSKNALWIVRITNKRGYGLDALIKELFKYE